MKHHLIRLGGIITGSITLGLLGRFYFGGEQFAVVCVLVVLALGFGAYMGATKSKSLTRRIDRDDE